MTEGAVFSILQPKAKSTLVVHNGFTIYFTAPMPSAWVRFWQKLLLGWTWRAE